VLRTMRTPWAGLAVALLALAAAIGGVRSAAAQYPTIGAQQCFGPGWPMCRQVCLKVHPSCACCVDWGFHYYPLGSGGGGGTRDRT
jgi:hypothetical protein